MTQPQSEFNRQLNEKVHAIAAAIQAAALELEQSVKITRESAVASILMGLRDLDNGVYTDGRAALWRARLRLYDRSDGYKEPVADSDPSLSAELPGEALHLSLPAVCGWIAELASEYHQAPAPGLGTDNLRHKLQGLRSQMSNRKDGTGTLTVKYEVLHNGQLRYMLARCDILREAATSAETARQELRKIRLPGYE